MVIPISILYYSPSVSSFCASRISAIDIRSSIHAAHVPTPKPMTTIASTRWSIARIMPNPHHSSTSATATTCITAFILSVTLIDFIVLIFFIIHTPGQTASPIPIA